MFSDYYFISLSYIGMISDCSISSYVFLSRWWLAGGARPPRRAWWKTCTRRSAWSRRPLLRWPPSRWQQCPLFGPPSTLLFLPALPWHRWTGWRWPGGVADSAHLGLGSCYCWSGHRQVGQISPSSDAVRSASSVLGISWTVFSAAELPTTAAVHAQRAGSSSTGLCDCVSIILSHYWYD